MNLKDAKADFKVAFGTVVRSVVPFIFIMLIWLVIVIVYPTLSLYLLGK
jgi:C4-dicarboxylate transporter DctM subunit